MTSVTAHTSDSVWDNVTPGMWYGSVVIGRTLCPHTTDDYACRDCSEYTYGTETSDVYAFSKVIEFAPDVNALCPDGWYVCDYELYLTPQGREHMWRTGDRWAFDEQNGPDVVTYDTYDAEMTV